jgi:hypothetical protein
MGNKSQEVARDSARERCRKVHVWLSPQGTQQGIYDRSQDL